MKSYVVNPTDGSLVSVEDWKKTENPTSAELVALLDEQTGKGLLIAKNVLGDYKFDEAQKVAAEYTNPAGGTFRCPTRREALDIYDSRFTGLDEAIAAVGGTPISGKWYWTADSDPDPEYSNLGAFVFSGSSGSVSIGYKGGASSVRPVSAFEQNN